MITHDIQRFSVHLAAIYSNLAKPVLDVILYNYQLSQNVGAEGLVLLTVLVQSSAALCTFIVSLYDHTLHCTLSYNQCAHSRRPSALTRRYQPRIASRRSLSQSLPASFLHSVPMSQTNVSSRCQPPCTRPDSLGSSNVHCVANNSTSITSPSA